MLKKNKVKRNMQPDMQHFFVFMKILNPICFYFCFYFANLCALIVFRKMFFSFKIVIYILLDI